MEDVFGFDDPEFSDRVLRIVEPGARPVKRTRRRTYPDSSGRLVHVNKWILCSQSDYFKNLFGKKFAESKSNEIEICVGKDETDAFIKLIHWFYFRAGPNDKKYSFEKSSFEELIKIIRLTDMFGAPDVILQDVYDELSKRVLSVKTCETLLELPDHITASDNFKALQNGAISKSLEYHSFLVMSYYMGFRKFRASSLGLLLQLDKLYLDSEEQIWCYLMQWLDYMERERGTIFPDETVDSLLKCVRFEHMDKNYMIQIVAQWPFWFKTVQRKELLVAALTTSDGKDKRFLSALGVEHFRPKRKLSHSPSIFPTRVNESYARGSVFGLPFKFHINEDKDAELFYLIGSIDFSHPCLNYLNPKSNIKVRVKMLDLNIDDELLDGSMAPAIYDGPCKNSDVPLCKFKVDKSVVLSPGDQMVYCMILA
eukprot:367280_1